MHYNNAKFGDASKKVNRTPYAQSHDESLPSPPGDSFVLIANSGEYLINNEDDYLVTNGES